MIRRPPRATRTDTLFPYTTLFRSCPDAMVILDNSDDYPVFRFGPGRYTAVGVGAGIGTEAKTLDGYRRFLQELRTPVVIDADGINLLAVILGKEPDFQIPGQEVLTPHVRDFSRSEARRVGKESVSQGRSRWQPDH